jgi:hypothetical protein
MNIVVGILGLLLIFSVLQESFETVILPRRVSNKFRVSRQLYRITWRLWAGIARKIKPGNRREYFLSYYGPLSVLMLLIVWATALVLAFALIQFGVGSSLNAPGNIVNFGIDLYMSGVTFFTLGYGDVVPLTGIARTCAVIETGVGFGFLALVIGYVPVIYQAFSRREVNISLLDARAGSPPSAMVLLQRHLGGQDIKDLVQYLSDWEHWCADILESHLSYPLLVYYRSQHEHQSWLAALTTILDACALVKIGVDGVPEDVGQFTFAIARHAAVDLAQIFGTSPKDPVVDRLPPGDFARLRDALADAGIVLNASAEERLAGLRAMYEPYVNALSQRLLMSLPAWIVTAAQNDDWQTSAWDHFSLTTQRPRSMKKVS